VPIKRLSDEPPPRRRRLSPKTRCPHCGKRTATVRGTCTECWGSKGGRLFTLHKRGPESAGDDIPSGCVWGCLSWAVALSALWLFILLGWT
jgi:hypothetical protein